MTPDGLPLSRAYVGWIRRFIVFHGRRHPAEMGPAEITAFLSTLATERCVGIAATIRMRPCYGEPCMKRRVEPRAPSE